MTDPPDRLPILSPGTHLSPDDGACLMELVSVLAGQRWSDQPSCTDPTLATVARVVNDELSSSARQSLAVLAADLIGRRGDPTRLAPAVVAACLDAAGRHARQTPRLDRHRRCALRRLRRPPTGAWPQAMAGHLYARGPAQHAITAAVLTLRALPPPARDTALRDMLSAAIAVVPPFQDHRPRGTAEARAPRVTSYPRPDTAQAPWSL